MNRRRRLAESMTIPSRFSINDLSFQIRNAYVDAFVDDDGPVLSWGFRVEASGEVDGELRRLAVSSEVLFNTQLGKAQPWSAAILGQATWRAPEDSEGEPRALIYVFEHVPLYECTVAIRKGEKREPLPRVTLSVAGKCDLLWKPGYTRGVHVVIQTDARFEGIYCGRDSREEALRNVARFLCIDDLEYRQDEAGVAIVAPLPG